jgi:hypothetical protein
MDSYRSNEANDTYCLGPDEAGALLAGAPWRRLLVMGDSIAAGIGDPVQGYLDFGWADRLAAALARVSEIRGESRLFSLASYGFGVVLAYYPSQRLGA